MKRLLAYIQEVGREAVAICTSIPRFLEYYAKTMRDPWFPQRQAWRIRIQAMGFSPEKASKLEDAWFALWYLDLWHGSPNPHRTSNDLDGFMRTKFRDYVLHDDDAISREVDIDE